MLSAPAATALLVQPSCPSSPTVNALPTNVNSCSKHLSLKQTVCLSVALEKKTEVALFPKEHGADSRLGSCSLLRVRHCKWLDSV